MDALFPDGMISGAERQAEHRHAETQTVHATALPNARAAHAGGVSLIAAAVGFSAAFSYLAVRFNYPSVLDGTAADVLPKLLALGDTGRVVWAMYAFLPLLLIPAAVGAYAALRDAAPHAMRAALTLGVVAAVCMVLGLARWPSVHWELARAYATSSPDARTAIDAVFNGLNVYLGNFIGEFLGELALNAFFILSAYALLCRGRRWSGCVGLAVGVTGLLAAFRNVTPVVALFASVDNAVLPLWLVALGVMLLRTRA